MKILYIWDADYPWDIRVEKICDSLQKFGHEVHIVSRNLNKLAEYELLGNIHIHRIRKRKNNKLNYVLSFPAFFNPVWKRIIEKVIIKYNIDLIIVRDLPMAIAGRWEGNKFNIPVIFDMAEDYCAMLKVIWNRKKHKGLNIFVRNPALARIIEKFIINKFEHIFVVTEETKELLLRKGVKGETITIIRNTPLLSGINRKNIDNSQSLELVMSRFSVIYKGGISIDRGLSVVINAIPYIIKEIKDFLFVVIGKGHEIQNLLEDIERKRLKDYVLWLGWIDHEKIYDYIASCKIGVIPQLVNDHVNTTVPNKLYDYMMCGLPIVSSDTIPMQRILVEEKCGIIFKSGNDMDFARAIISIYKNNNNYGENGINAVRQKYNWEVDENKLLNVINTFQR